MRRVLLLVLLAAGCSSPAPGPAVLDRNESCGSCRMAVSDVRFAGQIVAPLEEPRFFDDVGCLGRFVRESRDRTRRAVAYVTDHRTRARVRADRAVYTLAPSLATPMGSHLMAHADAASRDADPQARGGTLQALADVFGPDGPPRGE